ncbi:MAG: DUF885 domain-containing protein [Acidimicrobiales bacterium]
MPDKPLEIFPDVFEVSDVAVDRLAANDPTMATYQGIAGYENRWPDLSPEGLDATNQLYVDLKTQAEACPTPDDRHLLAQQVLIEYCDGMIASYEADAQHYELNNIASAHQGLRFVYGSQASASGDDWEAIIERVATVGQPLEGFRQTMEEGRLAGHTVSRRQVETVIEQGAMASGESSSFNQLRSRLSDAAAEAAEAGLAGFDAEVLAAKLDSAIVLAKQAYSSFNDYLSGTYLADAQTSDAAGEERYLLAARKFLGTDLDARATYRWGWDEVERLWGEMQAACSAIDPDVPVAAVIEDLQTNPKYAAATIEEFVEQMQARQTQALSQLEGVHFDVPDQIRTIDVQVEPAGGAAAAHYVSPSEDFSRAGSVWYPIAGQSHFPLFQEITIAYHEGFPGHHLQVGVQMAMGDELSRFHRSVAWYPGSGEGWALYAEHLMGELGYLERPEYVVGLLSSQLTRACRVAIDIGSHLELKIPDDVSFHPGESWSFDLAYELLTERALAAPAMAHSEVTRYFGWPGQAISYKVGEQAILDLRAERSAKGHFDPKAFHSDVLSVGSIGLDLMRDRLSLS